MTGPPWRGRLDVLQFILSDYLYGDFEGYIAAMIAFVQSTGAGVLAFLKDPHDQPEPRSVGFKGKRLLSLLLMDLLLTTMLMPLLYAISQTSWVDMDKHALNGLADHPWFVIIPLTVVAVPFVEELIFRLCLRFEQSFLVQPILAVAAIAGSSRLSRTRRWLHWQWCTYYAIIFYLSAVCFALVHLQNYEYTPGLVVLSPVLVAPQFVVGLFCGYLRVKYGFIWGFYLHALHNLVAVSLVLIFGV